MLRRMSTITFAAVPSQLQIERKPFNIPSTTATPVGKLGEEPHYSADFIMAKLMKR